MSSNARVKRTVTSELTFGFDVEAATVKKWLEEIPLGATIEVDRYESDNEPTETTFRAEWSG